MSENDGISPFNFQGAQIGDKNKQYNYFGSSYPQSTVAKAIAQELLSLKAARFFVGEVEPTDRAKKFSQKLLDGEYSASADPVKSIALAWCSRVLAYKEIVAAKNSLEEAEKHSDAEEVFIAKAFIASSEGDRSLALSILSKIDTPQSITARFLVVIHHDSPAVGIEWLKSAGYGFLDLDSDGKFLFISNQLDAENWDEAFDCVEKLIKKNFEETPVLHFSAALSHLLKATPEELRSALLRHPPLDAWIRLFDDDASLDSRRLAIREFLSCSDAARILGCDQAANIGSDYNLWLRLRDSEFKSKALEELKESLSESEHKIRRVPLALQCRIQIDLKQLESEIQQSIVRSGGVSTEVALGRLALAFEQKSHKDIALYVKQYKDQLCQCLDRVYIDSIQIEALSRSGDVDAASSCLAELVEYGLSENQKLKLENIIAESSGDESISVYKDQFEKTNELSDLVLLVKKLESHSEWEEMYGYALELFERTRSIEDAISLAFSMHNCKQPNDVLKFLDENSEFVGRSDQLRGLVAASYYQLGQFLDAKKELGLIEDPKVKHRHKELLVNIAISSGDWENLHHFVEEEWKNKDDYEPQSLIRVAKLAQSIGSPRAKYLVEAALSKVDNDPVIFMSAYGIAVGSGWEDSEVVGQWLNSAIELSTENGPIQRMSLADLMDRKPAWDSKENDVYDRLKRGDIPLFVAANTLNKSLGETFLLQALANVKERDPRRRVALPSYSGARGNVSGLESVKRIGLDASSLLTLGFLGVLDDVASVFETLIIPHSTLGWLFQEKQEISYHQPSRISDAKDIQRHIQNGSIKELSSNIIPDRSLTGEVGDELALFISTAEDKKLTGSEKKYIVVRPGPVHRAGSLMEEQADLSQYSDLITDCSSVVDKLKMAGKISSSDERRAINYLSLHEKKWPASIDFPDDAVLYLDDLSVTYFQHLGLLDVLSEAGFEVVISSGKVSETKSLINFEHLTNKCEEVVEKLRKFLFKEIGSGKVLVGQQSTFEEGEDSELLHHPAFSAMLLADEVDALLVDDRFFNKNLGGKLLTTHEVIDFFCDVGYINNESRCELKTTLRDAGYLFVSLPEEELEGALSSALVVEGKLIESMELRAIRENFLKVQMSGYCSLPNDGVWLANTVRVITSQIRKQWHSDIDDPVARARSEWLAEFIDVRCWAGSFDFEVGGNFSKVAFVHQIMSLLIAPTGAGTGEKERYFKWIEDYLWPQIISDNNLFNLVVERAKGVVFESIDNKQGVSS